MLPQAPENSEYSEYREPPRIIPLHPQWVGQAFGPVAELEQRLREARHFLKFMLPGVPITVFVMSFVFGYVVVGIHTTAPSHTARFEPLDPMQPLLGATLLATATAIFCCFIYWGFMRITRSPRQ